MERKSVDQMKLRKPSGAAVMRDDLTAALFRALFEEWAAMGYNGISLERVAIRAGAGKGAIYRRWPSKLAFSKEAFEAVQIKLTDTADQGSLVADLHGYLKMMQKVLRHRLVKRILPDLYAEKARSGETAPLLERMAYLRREQGYGIIERAIARSELPATIQYELALDIIPSGLYWRMAMRGKSLNPKDTALLVSAIVAALKVL
ncbi:TetR/AcrR family transcriptional regulator [Rouxiella sp. Mn2063]|uniref:TetR/AcrR family transcriptional regulator n=1 Tax=Rouxiella sp. Mn2063 TaxID=3395262 RepID=UPI003BC64510